jgi:Ser/Thr protein kinase RdoA (MazF antagonist)
MTTPSLPPAASAEHLTAALRKCGALGHGRVRNVVVESSRDTLISHIIRLRLAYDGEASNAPRSVILKIARASRVDKFWFVGHYEVAFYRDVAPAMPARIVPRCFEAARDEETKAWHLLLEDLTDTHHITTAWPLPPTADECKSIVRALAGAHAAWWDDPRLGSSVGTWLDVNSEDRDQKFAEQVKTFIDRAGGALPEERRGLYRRLLDSAPRLTQRYASHRNLTITHGDAHVWNFLLPQDPASEAARVFDWDAWHINAGTNDLAYMMAMHWYPDRRRSIERPLLDCYHETLIANGIQGYDRRALDDDYRLSVLWHITTPARQHAFDIPPGIWWNNLERIFMAFDDLDCRELLG